MHKKNKPNFLVVGAAKSGTTSLFHYLNQHPDIYIPEVKECRFFSQLPKDFNGLGAEFFPNSGITDEKVYFDLFQGHEDKVCGDISNDYLYYYKESVRNIKKYLGDEVKIIIILRNPIDRAYSNYMHAVRDGWENLTFEESIIEETYRIQANWGWPYHYIQVGFYYQQVKAYLDNFLNVRVYLFEDLKNKDEFLNDLYEFLNVKKIQGTEEDKVFNISGYPKNKFIHRLLIKDSVARKVLKPFVKAFFSKEKIQQIMTNLKNKNLEKKELNFKTRLYLEKLYREDIKKLSLLIKRDLSRWIKDEM